MGKPKFSRKKYETPSHPWQEDRIKEENEMVKKYGLKNKREIWKAQTKLKKYRSQARELLAKVGTGDAQSKKESNQLLIHLNRLNILPLNSTLDDVLALNTESLLSRRLQTLAYLKGFAGTPTQARQLISHGHVSIGEKKVTVPGYIVTKDEESEISYMADSPLNDTMHPARPKAEFKPSPVKRDDVKPVEEKPAEPETPPSKPTSETPAKPAETTTEKITAEETTPKPVAEPAEPKTEQKLTEPETPVKPVEEPTKEEPTEKKPQEETKKETKPAEEPSKEKTETKKEENKEGGN